MTSTTVQHTPRPATRARTGTAAERLRRGAEAWSALVAHSVSAAHDLDRAPTRSARQQVLARFVDRGV